MGSEACILVVEDAFPIRMLLKEILEAEGYRVTCAEDGEDALHKAQAHRPDLVILDIMLPRMNGFEVAKALKRDARLGSIPIIFLTALMDPWLERKARSIGAEAFLNKPVDRDALLNCIRHLLAQKGEGARA